ncbi:hypothetical protein PGTUg99_022872 [Puccinia graminis f. sp. tritici]|uniref:Uncharacterized protein n=1 Tax=Puccinia graminis f. sp. tritici TaxID=56615 RepID=A0A5B0P1U3_PUCGR|nr:hypothetical protein PGTUg99_022872 [Puccinia graminis f. sp. tritici]
MVTAFMYPSLNGDVFDQCRLAYCTLEVLFLAPHRTTFSAPNALPTPFLLRVISCWNLIGSSSTASIDTANGASCRSHDKGHENSNGDGIQDHCQCGGWTRCLRWELNWCCVNFDFDGGD